MELASKLLFSFFSLFFFLFCFIAYAQDSPTDYVDAHNAARALVGVPAISWDATVAAYAQNYANQRKADCKVLLSGGIYGENIEVSHGAITGTDAVKLWVALKTNYDYNTNTCIGNAECGEYTQVVWSDSIRLGCGKVTCDNGGTFIVCNYDPPGNVKGERPY